MPHAPTIAVVAESAGWEQKMRNAINDGNYVQVIIRGTKAGGVKNKMFDFPDPCRVPAPPAPPVPTPFPKLSACLTVWGFWTLSSLIMHAVTRCGYGLPKVLFNSKGRGSSDDEFYIDLT